VRQILIAIDQVFNTLVWLRSEGFGKCNETLSSRAWRLRHDSDGYKVINAIFFWQPDHYMNAYKNEVIRNQEYK
jgi:hypothetical protein